MKKSNIIIAIVALIFSAHMLHGQSQIILSSTNLGTVITKEIAKKSATTDHSAVKMITDHLKQNSQFSLDKFNYANEVRVEVQVDLSETGALTSYAVLNYYEEEITAPIFTALSNLKKVNPIITNGKTRAQRLIIPLIIKK